jgi:hypothetical protein
MRVTIIYEAVKEKYADVKEQCGRSTKEFNSMQDERYELGDGRSCEFVLCTGGDEPSIGATYSTSGASATYCCNMCRVKKDDLFAPTPEGGWPMRTLEEAGLLACPAWKVTITAANMLDGDSGLLNTARQKHAKTHFGQQPGLKRGDSIPCGLHAPPHDHAHGERHHFPLPRRDQDDGRL